MEVSDLELSIHIYRNEFAFFVSIERQFLYKLRRFRRTIITLYIKTHFQETQWFLAVSSPVILVSALKRDEAPALTFPTKALHKNNYQQLNEYIKIL